MSKYQTEIMFPAIVVRRVRTRAATMCVLETNHSELDQGHVGDGKKVRPSIGILPLLHTAVSPGFLLIPKTKRQDRLRKREAPFGPLFLIQIPLRT